MTSCLQVQVVNAKGEVIWLFGRDTHGNQTGLTSTGYAQDGTLVEIIDALRVACDQALGERITLG